MFKQLKGLLKRYTTPKPKKDYTPEDDYYGKYEWKVISLYKNEFGDSNIILELDYDSKSELKNMHLHLEFLVDNLNKVGLRTLHYSFKDTDCIVIAGSITQYISILTIDNLLLNLDTNRVYRSFINILCDIDIMHPMIDNVTKQFGIYTQTDYYPYETTITKLNSNNPITIQSLITENIYNEILDTDYMESFIYLMVISVCEKDFHIWYISDLVNILNFNDDIREQFKSWKESMYYNFNIPGFKNIFDINLKVTDDDESMYDDIDEVIE